MTEPTERIAILLELQQQEFARNAKRAGAEIDRLERKTNPLAAAQTKLEARQLRYNAALEAGTIDLAQHAKGMDLAQREYDQTSEKLSRATKRVLAMNSAVAAQTGFMTRNRSLFQQAGFQVGDFAVQVQGGTSALTAFTQQGSQLLGVLGPWGAVMGAVLAVGAPLAGVLFSLGDATEETKEKARTFQEKVDDAQAALAAMSSTAGDLSDLDALQAKFGEVTQGVRELAGALIDIDRRKAVQNISAVMSEITKQIAATAEQSGGAVTAALLGAGTEAAKAEADLIIQQIKELEGEISALEINGQFVDPSQTALLAEMNQELAAVQGRFADIGTLASEIAVPPELLAQILEAQAGLESAFAAENFAGAAEQMSMIRQLFEESGIASQDVLDKLVLSEAQAREMAVRLDEGAQAADDIANADMAGNIASAATSAAALRNILREAASASGAISDLNSSNPDFFDPRGESPNAGVFNTERPNNSRRATRPAPSARASGSARRSGGRAVQAQPDLFTIAEAELEKLDRQIELLGKSKSEVAELTTKHMLLEEAKKRGLAITDELTAKIDAEAAEVGQLAEKYDLARDRIAAMEQIQGQFKDSVIDAATGGADAFDNFTRSIKRAALEYALFGSGPFGQGGGGGGGLLGGLFGGGGGGLFAGFFDRGGNIPAGKFGIAGERGPEIVRGPAMVTSRAETARMMQGGQGGAQIVPVEVNIINNGNSQVDQRRRSGPNGQEILDIEISRSISSGRQDQAMKRYANSNPATVIR